MKKAFLSRLIISIMTVGILVGIVQMAPVHAQSADPSAAQGLQISPAIVELNAEKGKTYTLNLKVTNVTLARLVYSTTVNDFDSKDETGAANVLLTSTLPPTASIITWLKTGSEFSLDSHESRNITAEITVPNDAEAGGHYGVLRFSGHAPDVSGTGVGLSASAGMLILIRVAGNITESANLASFYTVNGTSQTSFFENAPINFVTRIKNDGNIHVKPTGTITIQDAFGNTVGTVPVNDSKAIVLPSSIRRFDSEYKSGWMFGMYTANLTMGYGTTGQAITNTVTFWVIPYKLILVLLLCLVTFVFIASRLIKVYNKRIIAKAKNENVVKNNKAHKTKK
jgi:hypothetical protein